MSPLRFLILGVALLGAVAHGGTTADTPYTIRGKTDFDTALRLLNPYGTWSKIGDKWAYTPLDHLAPYTSGRWLYTEYGWYWKGNAPHSWATEHYGFWKRGADKVWSWFPGPYWLPQIVEIRATDKYLGWRSAEVDESGNFVEPPVDRFTKTEQWVFVTLSQFANPITPAIVAPVNIARTQLEDSTDCRHTYMTYRIIDRPGPHPADFADLCKDGGMLAPMTPEYEASLAQKPAPDPYAVTLPATNDSALLGQEVNPAADARKVHYWITMSLPTYWTKPPPDAKPTELYVYRPDFFQDQDGVERRITLWFNPSARTSLKDVLAEHMPAGPSPSASGPTIPAQPAQPASDRAHNPFSSPLDESYHPAPSPTPATNAAATPNTKGPVPSGKVDEGTK